MMYIWFWCLVLVFMLVDLVVVMEGCEVLGCVVYLGLVLVVVLDLVFVVVWCLVWCYYGGNL